MTRGGASAKRMKMAAKETASTPTSRVMYAFTLIIIPDYSFSKYLGYNLSHGSQYVLGYDKLSNFASIPTFMVVTGRTALPYNWANLRTRAS